MKKYLAVFFILFFSIIYAQENYKGKISFVFNMEKIELPINVVSLKKENNVLISIQAEQNNENRQQSINLKWEFKKLSTEDKDLSMFDSFFLNVMNNNENRKDELLVSMANDGKVVVKNGNESWNANSISMKFDIQNVSFENSSIVIKGKMDLKAGNKENKSVSQLENCKFEIVI